MEKQIKVRCKGSIELTLQEIQDFQGSLKELTEENFLKLRQSIIVHGFIQPFAIWVKPNGDKKILDGHQRSFTLKRIEKEGYILPNKFPCYEVEAENEAEAKRILLQKVSEYGKVDKQGLYEYIEDAEISHMELDSDFNIPDLDYEDFKLDYYEDEEPEPEQEESRKGNLNKNFVVPPFTILDTRQGYWQDRKKYWREEIGDNGESREGTLAKDSIMADINSGVSILDPVLAEIVNKWFVPTLEVAKTFDCFAGDTVFGFVSGTMGNHFTGVELRKEQAELNNNRVADAGLNAFYINDDGQNVAKHIEKESQDLLFSCPPYYDLEVYSDLENDASNQETYEDFLKILDNAFSEAITCLKDNRFAVITVGDLRDKEGFYYRFCDHIKDIFERNGCRLYNHMIIVDMIGTAHMRANNAMKNRKVIKTHQDVLVFYKGEPKDIQKHFKNLNLDLDLQPEPIVETDKLRYLTADDFNALESLRKPCVKDKQIMYLQGGIIKEALENKHMVGIFDNDELVAYVWFKNMPRKKVTKIEEIISTKKGLGRELVELVISQAEYPKLILECVKENTATDFYKKLNFKVVDEKDGKVPVYVFERDLANESTDV